MTFLARVVCTAFLFAAACTTDSPTPTPPDGPSAPGAITVAMLGLKNLSTPAPDLHCAGQPTEAQFDQLAKAGVQRVVTLRPATEKGTGWEEARAAAAGVTFVRLPIVGAEDLTPANVQRLADELGKPGAGPTLLCCGSSNRVGAMLALKAAWLDKKPAAEALAAGKAAGLASLAPKVEALLKP